MRHFDQLACDVRDALFHQPPQSFDRDSERSVLAQSLGATLYVPATKDGLAGAVRRQAASGAKAMVIDLEESGSSRLARSGKPDGQEERRSHHHYLLGPRTDRLIIVDQPLLVPTTPDYLD